MEVFGDKTYIIAEVGSNHKRDFQLAKAHIDAAKEAGADAVKFQSLNVEKLYYNPSQEIKDLHSVIDLDESWLTPLKEYCDEIEIDFCSSPTYFEAVDLLEKIDVKFHKLASAQIGTFPQIVEKVAKLNKPTLFSTGIVSYEELATAVDIFKRNENDKFLILHCNSIYPTPADKVNLGRMNIYREMFGNKVGFSDHTLGIHIPIAAVTLGAKVIEKHFVLDERIVSPDSAISIKKDEFALMVKAIRDIELANKDLPRVELEEDEANFKNLIKYKLVLKRDKKIGESFVKEDFLYLRDLDGIDVREEQLIINNFCAKSDINSNSLLQWNDLEGKR